MLGRASERAVVDAMLDAARAGRSASLLVEGEPGIGKTCLCQYATGAAPEFAVLRAQGAEAESHISFTALEQLLHPLQGRLHELPGPQRRALAGALAVEDAGPVPPLAVGAATLSLLAAEAESGPLLVIADDIHWFDPASAQAASFAARRLDREGVAFLATRRAAEGPVFEVENRITLDGLAATDAAHLLRDVSGVDVAPDVVDALVTATGGNPLALRSAAEELGPAVLRGEAPRPDPLPLGRQIGETYRRRVEALPDAARLALVVLAAVGTEARPLLEPALALLGLEMAVLEPAEAVDIVALTPLVAEFHHPLMRSAAYHAAAPRARRAAHRALAEAAEMAGDVERQAWHLAAAASGPDEAAAASLARAGRRAAVVGGAVAAAPALDRAAQLTPPGEVRARRLVAAAHALFLSGRLEEVGSRLDEALRLTEQPVVRADAARLRAQLMANAGARQEAIAFVRAEARLVAPHDRARAALMLCEMALPSVWAGQLDAALELSREASELASEAGGPTELLASNHFAQLLIFRGEVEEGARLLREVDARWEAQPSVTNLMMRRPATGFICIEDHDRAEEVLRETIAAARASGAVTALPFHLGTKAELDFITGDWLSSYAAATECVELAAHSGQPHLEGYGWAGVARVEAGQGAEDDCRSHAARAEAIGDRSGSRYLLVHVDAALGLLELGLGRPREARVLLEPVFTWLAERRFDGMIAKERLVPDLIEATIACDERTEAARLLTSFESIAVRTDRSWARAAAHRCRAMLALPRDAEAHYRAALALHRRTRTPFDRARTELAYGEWLRSVGRRADAERQLGTSRHTFARLGARPWAGRAAGDPSTPGAGPVPPSWVSQLTPQELQVALAVAEGASNKEVAASLFVSHRTVESHLTVVFRKARVRSRSQLTRALLTGGGASLSPKGGARGAKVVRARRR